MTIKYYTLITGASTGFGRALALQCAARKQNLVLVSLPCKELYSLGNFIQKNFSVNVYCFEKDLSQEQSCNELFNEIKSCGLQINILINNAGLGGTNYFEERELSFYQKQLQVNVLAPTCITYLFLEELKKNSPSHVLNVSSLACFFCVPKKQVYGGSKSYLLSFSRSLGYELKKFNVSVSVVCPGAMNTTPQLICQNKQATFLLKWSVMNPEAVAKITIKKMLIKKSVIIPGFFNRFIKMLNKILPGKIKDLMISAQLKRMEDIAAIKQKEEKPIELQAA